MRVIAAAIFCILLLPFQAYAQTRAYLGAKGWGAFDRHAFGGGVDPVLCTVNTLSSANSGSANVGSLHYCLTRPYPRIIVFEVSGAIVLQKELKFNNQYWWLAGATAPSPGIQVHAGQLNPWTGGLFASHFLMDNIELWAGAEADWPSSGSITCDSRAPFHFQGVTDGTLRNVTLGTSTDQLLDSRETTNARLGLDKVAFIFPLNNSCHSKGAHGYGPIFYPNYGITIYNSLVVHAAQRQIRLYSRRTEAVLNVFYNAGPGTADWTTVGEGISGESGLIDHSGIYHLSFKQNLYKCGLNTGANCSVYRPITGSCNYNQGPSCGFKLGSKVCVDKNKHTNQNGTLGFRPDLNAGTDWDVVNPSAVPSATFQVACYTGADLAASGDFDTTVENQDTILPYQLANYGFGSRTTEAASGTAETLAAARLVRRAQSEALAGTGTWVNTVGGDLGGYNVVASHTRALSSVAGGPPNSGGVVSRSSVNGDGETAFEVWYRVNFTNVVSAPLVAPTPTPTPTPTSTPTGTPAATATPTATPTNTPTPTPNVSAQSSLGKVLIPLPVQ